MVSLRQRKSHPSYTSMAGLEDLSDGEDRPGSGSNTPAGPSTKMDVEGAESDASLSSGKSSAFEPGSDDGGKKKKSKNAKGKGKAGARGRSASAFEASQVDSDEDMSDGAESESIPPEEEDLGDIASVAPTPRGLKGGRGRGGAPKKPRNKSTAVTLAEITPSYAMVGAGKSSDKIAGDTMAFPPAYKQVIKASAEYLAKPPKQDAESREKRYEKYKKYGLEGFAEGPTTPFTTNLTAHPRKSNNPGVQVSFEEEDTAKRRWLRQSRMFQTEEKYPIYTPWKHWEGEGWWKGMYEPVQDGGKKGKAKATSKSGGLAALESQGWRMREDISFGLEGVGRYTAEDLDMISHQQALPYLPDVQSVTCHLGPHKSQRRETFTPFQTQNLQRPDQEGYLFFAGGPIWGMDWCPGLTASSRQYLAVSTLKHSDDKPTVGTRRPRDDLSCIQIWSLDTAVRAGPGPWTGAPAMRCEMVICIRGGAAMDLKWMPIGAQDRVDDTEGTLPKLGILAAVQLDGSVSFYSIPNPAVLRQTTSAVANDPIYLRMHEPILRLNVDDATCSCIDWMTGSRLVAGLSNGHAILWDVLDALMNGASGESPFPLAYMLVGNAPVGAVSAARQPTSDINGLPIYDADPVYVVFATYEGTIILVDIRDPDSPVEVNRERKPGVAVTWAPQLAAPLYANGDNALYAQKVFGGGKHRGYSIASHRGAIWSIATSDYHCIAASTSADGGMLLCNYSTGWYRKRKQPVMHHRVYEMDYGTHSGEYRMTDDFLPEAAGLVIISDRFNPKKQAELAPVDPRYVSTAAWRPEVGVHKVTWNTSNGLRNAGWLASGMACGLGRVEWVDRAKS